MLRQPYVFIFLLLLSACEMQPVQEYSPPAPLASATSPKTELQALFEQAYIDPLTDYLEQNQNKAELRDALARVKAEREKRCADIAALYQKRDKTQANLEKLRAGYQRSCPHVVDAFAALLNTPRQASRPRPAKDDDDSMSSNKIEAVITEPAPVIEPAVDSQTYAAYRQQVLLNCQLKLAKKNMQAVIDSCQRLAQQGEALAQTYLGTAYLHQNKVEQAEYWWRKAAKQGLAQAQYHLGALYAEGKVVEQDWERAFEWLQRAALQGLSAAQYGVGQLYATGHGVAQDNIEALAWWYLASQQGHTNAKTQQERLRQQLPPIQWQQAKRRAQRLKQRYTGKP